MKPQNAQWRYWLALSRTPGIGNQTLLHLAQQAVLPEQVFALPHAGLKALGFSETSINALKQPDWDSVGQDLEWLSNPDNHLLTILDEDYPPQLQEIASAPALLFLKGDYSLLNSPQLAMVGSRNPSRQGEQTAHEFAAALAFCGWTITSGLALGIDAASHEGALAVNGKTIAVAGTGLDRVYPASHKQLATQIAETGLLVSEFPPGTPAKSDHFPRRNRIISGLCQGLLVVEAAQQSGSLITARMALDQNREVFAIPGSIHNPLARGCNALIRQGAKLVETVEDVLEELGQYNQLPIKDMTEIQHTELDLEHENLLKLIAYSPTTVDSLVQYSGMSVETVSSILLVLELQGYIASAGGSYFRI